MPKSETIETCWWKITTKTPLTDQERAAVSKMPHFDTAVMYLLRRNLAIVQNETVSYDFLDAMRRRIHSMVTDSLVAERNNDLNHEELIDFD